MLILSIKITEVLLNKISYTFYHQVFSSSVLCVLIVDGMSVVVNVMLSLMSVMSLPPALCNLSVRTAVKLCILGGLALGVSLVS